MLTFLFRGEYMKEPIGKIILGDKMIGWTDLSNQVKLTIKNPVAYVYPGYNMASILEAVKQGKIKYEEF